MDCLKACSHFASAPDLSCWLQFHQGAHCGRKTVSFNGKVNSVGDGKCDYLPQQPMNVCFGEQAEELNRLHRQLITDLGGPMNIDSHSRLRAIEESWLENKDDYCIWEGSFYEGGTLQPTIISTCIIRLHGIASTCSRSTSATVPACIFRATIRRSTIDLPTLIFREASHRYNYRRCNRSPASRAAAG